MLIVGHHKVTSYLRSCKGFLENFNAGMVSGREFSEVKRYMERSQQALLLHNRLPGPSIVLQAVLKSIMKSLKRLGSFKDQHLHHVPIGSPIRWQKEIDKLSEQNELYTIWVPGNCGIDGNITSARQREF